VNEKHVAHHVTPGASRHLAFLWIPGIAEIDKYDLERGVMVKSVHCKRDECLFDGSGRVRLDLAAVRIEPADFGVTLPIQQTFIAPGAFLC
jgi:hypothetical protein